MEQAIQKITDAIYQEGLNKGKAEAERLIADARKQAEQMVAEAQTQAAAIQAAAQKEAVALSEHTRAELKLYADQALNALKSEIAKVVTDKLTAEAVKKMSADKDFLGKFLVEVAGKWAAGDSLVITSAQADELKAYFAAHAKALLDAGVEIKKGNCKDAFFTLMPADGSYKVKFGETEFENYIKDFLRPQLIEMLF